MMYSKEEQRRLAELMLELERTPEPASARSAIKPLFITLQEWAAASFSKVPHNNTLLRWVHEGRIQPQPEKIGRIWRVKPAAVYKAD